MWRENYLDICYYQPDSENIWNRIDLCIDIRDKRFCLVSERRAREGVVNYVSEEFAQAFMKEFTK